MKLKQSFPAPRSAWLDHIVSALMQGTQTILAEKIVDAGASDDISSLAACNSMGCDRMQQWQCWSPSDTRKVVA